jgi:hypothetical protein
VPLHPRPPDRSRRPELKLSYAPRIVVYEPGILTLSFRLRTGKGKLKIEHSILENLRPVLDRLVLRDDIRSIIPGVIRQVRDAKGVVKIHVTVPTQNGWKAIALANGARQELFISTEMTEDQLARALKEAIES